MSDALPPDRLARPPAFEATSDKIKTKQNAYRSQKLRCLPPETGWRPVCPLHLQLGAGAPGPRRAPPRLYSRGGNCSAAQPKAAGTHTAGDREEPPSPPRPRSWRKRSSGTRPLQSWWSRPQETPSSPHWRTFLPSLMSTPCRTFFTPNSQVSPLPRPAPTLTSARSHTLTLDPDRSRASPPLMSATFRALSARAARMPCTFRTSKLPQSPPHVPHHDPGWRQGSPRSPPSGLAPRGH